MILSASEEVNKPSKRALFIVFLISYILFATSKSSKISVEGYICIS